MEIIGKGQMKFDFLSQIPEDKKPGTEMPDPSKLVRLGRPVDVQLVLSEDLTKPHLGRRKIENPNNFTSDYSDVIKKTDPTFWDLKLAPAWR